MKRVLLVTLLAAALPAAACKPELPGGNFSTTEGRRYAAAWRTQPAAVEIGRHFTVEIALCAREGATAPEALRVDAHMPEHRHGMNYKTRVSSVGAGRYSAEGLMFHMPGRWEYIFEVRAGEHTERLTSSVVLK
jgi:hypothetical protein